MGHQNQLASAIRLVSIGHDGSNRYRYQSRSSGTAVLRIGTRKVSNTILAILQGHIGYALRSFIGWFYELGNLIRCQVDLLDT